MAWLAVEFPNLALEWCSRGLGDAQTVVLLDSKHKVSQCNQIAAAQGVEPGMTLATLLALVDDVTLVSDSDARRLYGLTPSRELGQSSVKGNSGKKSAGKERRSKQTESLTSLDALQQLALWANDYSAQILLVPPQSLVIEIGSMLRLFGGLPGYLAQFEHGLQQLDYPCRWATAHTPVAAFTLAYTATAWRQVSAKSTMAQLVRLPVTSLPISVEQKQSLERLGLSQLEQLLALPAAQVRKRLGGALLCWLLELQGRLQPRFTRFVVPPQFEMQLPLLAEIVHIHGLLFPLRRLLEGMVSYMRHRQLATTSCLLSLTHRDQPATLIRLNSAAPEVALAEWLQLSQLQLERHQLVAPVISMSLCCDQWVELTAEAKDLLQAKHGQGLSRLQLLGRLQSQLGSEQLYGLRCGQAHTPEHAWQRAEPSVSPASASSVSVSSAEPPSVSSQETGSQLHSSMVPIRRPSWLLDPAQPLTSKNIQILDGPERISSGWWRWPEPAVLRDYFVAKDGDGRLCWIYKDAQGSWFVHGWFS
ncbi:DNA polymerase Y family protein [Corallincola platygyrae]|uniref:DNA polymerase Y family protein n=1 Tax=Corallincola platygyrae TaxID=1193278 RepID=A0ABW4XSK5_9GAMM